MNRLMVIIVTMGLMLVTGCSGLNSEGVKLNNQGLAYYEDNEYIQALNAFSAAIEEETIPTYYINQGMVFIALEAYQEAYTSFQKAIERDKDATDAYYGSGLAKLYLGDHEAAITYFNETIERDKGYILAYRNRGIGYLYLNQLKKAYEDFSQAYDLDPKNAEHYLDLAYYYESVDDREKVIENYDKALEDEGIAGRAYLMRGLYYLTLGEKEKGIEDLKAAGANREVKAYLSLAQFYQKEGNLTEAMKHYERYLKDNKTVSGYNQIGLLALEAGAYEQAVSYFLEAHTLGPLQKEVLYNLSRTYELLGNYEEAKHYIVKLLEETPEDHDALLELAYIESRLLEVE